MDKLFSWDKIHLHWFQQSASLESCYIIRTSLRVYIGFLIGQFLICTKSSWIYHFNLRKQPTFQDTTTGFPTEWRLRNKCRNSILMMCHYPGLGSDSDWSYCKGNLLQAIRSTIPWSGYWHIISMEFLCSSLKCHFVFYWQMVPISHT